MGNHNADRKMAWARPCSAVRGVRRISRRSMGGSSAMRSLPCGYCCPCCCPYASHVCVGGYPDEWDRVWPGMTLQKAVELCGEPDQKGYKFSLVWRRMHLLGRHELLRHPDDQERIYEVELVVVFFKCGRRNHVFFKSCGGV